MSNDFSSYNISEYDHTTYIGIDEDLYNYVSMNNEVDPIMGAEDHLCKDYEDKDMLNYVPEFIVKSENEKHISQIISTLEETNITNEYSHKIKENFTFDVLVHGTEEEILGLFKNKNKENFTKVKIMIEQQPEIVSLVMFPIIRNHFCNFFDSSEEGLSLELLKLLINEFDEKEANNFLWVFVDNYEKIIQDNKETAIDIILFLFNNGKVTPNQKYTFLIGSLYLVSRHLKEMLTNAKALKLVYFIINEKNEYINNILFKIILDNATYKTFQMNELSFVKQFIIDKYKMDFENSVLFIQLKNTLEQLLLHQKENHLIDVTQNLKEYLLTLTDYSYDPDKDEEITTFLISKTKQQTFSKELQDLAKENKILVDKIFIPFLISRIYELSIDKYSKFFVCEIIEHFPDDKLPSLVEALKPQFAAISVDKQGTRVIQSILNRCYSLYCESVNKPKYSGNCLLAIIYLLNNISTHIVELMTNKHSAHIVTTLIKCQIPSINDLLYQILAQNLMDIVTNQFGCGRIRDILELQIKNDANYCNYLIYKVVNEVNLPILITDQYGHYLIIYLLNLRYNFSFKKVILEYLMQNFVFCAKHKYSSSIIEKCITTTTFFNSKLQDDSCVKELAADSIGYYVLIAVINSNDANMKDTKNKLLKTIIKNKKEISCSTTGDLLLKKIKKKK